MKKKLAKPANSLWKNIGKDIRENLPDNQWLNAMKRYKIEGEKILPGSSPWLNLSLILCLKPKVRVFEIDRKFIEMLLNELNSTFNQQFNKDSKKDAAC